MENNGSSIDCSHQGGYMMSAALDHTETGRQNYRKVRNHNGHQYQRRYNPHNNQNFTGSSSAKQDGSSFLFIGNIGGFGIGLALFALAAAFTLFNTPSQNYSEDYDPNPYIPEQDPKIIEIDPADITVI